MQLEINNLFKVAEVEITYKSSIRPQERIQVASADAAYSVFKQTWDENKIELLEQFKILLLDNRCNCLGVAEIATGTVTACLADPRLIFATALKTRATGFIMAHNHPSGNLRPSNADIALTKKLVEGGKLLEIAVRDHIIITNEGYHSFALEGMMPG